MMNSKQYDFIKYLVRTLSISIVPPIISMVFKNTYPNNDRKYIWGIIIGCVMALIINVFIEYNLLHIKFLRKYSKYEGKWIEIIPEFNGKSITVCHIEYNYKNNIYKFYGKNYYDGEKQGTDFISEKLIIDNNGFYYVTNPLKDKINCFGEVIFNKNNVDGLIRADGYFYDIKNNSFSGMNETIMIKCNKSFCKKINFHSYKTFKKFTDIQIINNSKDFLKEEIERSKKVMK